MTSPGITLFSPAALAVLDQLIYDPTAKGRYEFMSGGLIWGDEFPEPGSTDWDLVSPNWVYRFLVAYRASLTLGENREEFRPVWEQVMEHAPNWPGLRPERRGERARRRLLAAKRLQAPCLAELDRLLDPQSDK